MRLALEVAADAEEAARRVGSLIAERAREADYRFSFALSKAPPAMLGALVAAEPPWDAVGVFQVDERAAPADDSARNLVALLEALPHDSIHPMPVEDPELEAAARQYAAELPPSLDLVHLGLGPDGHTASLIPGDPVLEIADRLVAVTGEYQGHLRMTLTYPALEAAREIVWLVTGGAKQEVLARLLARDDSIPAGRISNPRQLVVADADAAALAE